MKLIASFSVDHTRIVPGIFTSRVDTLGEYKVTTYDIRLKRPNIEPPVDVAAMHSLEHIVATYLRNNDNWKDDVVYWGPMGCLTGFYLIVKTSKQAMPKDVEPYVRAAFRHQAKYTGEVPGATPVNCGNYLLHDLPMARIEAKAFLAREWKFDYPKARRTTAKGKVFFDA